MNNKFLNDVENTLGYRFQNDRLLVQAFVRRSFSFEHSETLNNEVLEFYGDRALELVIMKTLSERYGSLTKNGQYASEKNEGQLTEIKKNLVNTTMLAHRMDRLDLASYLLMGKGDEKLNIDEEDSVKEDLFEAILGAVAIDSNWNLQVLERVVNSMLNPQYYLDHGFLDSENYVALLQTWFQKKYQKLPEYDLFDKVNGGYECLLTLPGELWRFRGEGTSKSAARMSTAKQAYLYLAHTNKLISWIDEIGMPTVERAVNQLQELFQKGYIGEAEHMARENGYHASGNLIWHCECCLKINGREIRYSAEHTSAKQGKKLAAYKVLCDLLDMEVGDEA